LSVLARPCCLHAPRSRGPLLAPALPHASPGLFLLSLLPLQGANILKPSFELSDVWQMHLPHRVGVPPAVAASRRRADNLNQRARRLLGRTPGSPAAGTGLPSQAKTSRRATDVSAGRRPRVLLFRANFLLTTAVPLPFLVFRRPYGESKRRPSRTELSEELAWAAPVTIASG
jgi:hypothetical protein